MKNNAGILDLSLPMSILDSTISHVMDCNIQKYLIKSLVEKYILWYTSQSGLQTRDGTLSLCFANKSSGQI